jgi:hypothetical protein
MGNRSKDYPAPFRSDSTEIFQAFEQPFWDVAAVPVFFTPSAQPSGGDVLFRC